MDESKSAAAFAAEKGSDRVAPQYSGRASFNLYKTTVRNGVVLLLLLALLALDARPLDIRRDSTRRGLLLLSPPLTKVGVGR